MSCVIFLYTYIELLSTLYDATIRSEKTGRYEGSICMLINSSFELRSSRPIPEIKNNIASKTLQTA